MSIIDAMFGIKTNGGPTGALVEDAELNAKLQEAGYNDLMLQSLHFYNTYNKLPEGTRILLRGGDAKHSPTAVVVPFGNLRPIVSGSILGSQILGRSGSVQGSVQQLLALPTPGAKRILESDPVSNPGEDAFVKLQFPPSLALQADPQGEERMLQQVNHARAQVGLSPLRTDPLLQQAAREHSADMYKRHYFSHRTPDGKTPYDRLRDLRFHYVTAGENLAFAPDVDQAFDSLMKSPDHRANILNPDFRCIGIGAYQGLNGYEEMFTQDFADCS